MPRPLQRLAFAAIAATVAGAAALWLLSEAVSLWRAFAPASPVGEPGALAWTLAGGLAALAGGLWGWRRGAR